ncbi:MAG: hypothetical protein AVDCRST_MAG77-1770, partial [uncultured Chloroflexi bacterium]
APALQRAPRRVALPHRRKCRVAAPVHGGAQQPRQARAPRLAPVLGGGLRPLVRLSHRGRADQAAPKAAPGQHPRAARSTATRLRPLTPARRV